MWAMTSASPGTDGIPPPPKAAVDWDLALATARRVGGAGPRVTPEEAGATVAELHGLARQAQGHVAGLTGLDASSDSSPVQVVNRGGWAQANAGALDQLLTPLVHRLEEQRRASEGGSSRSAAGPPSGPTGVLGAVGSRVAGLEAGVLLGFLSSRILGQYDPFHEEVDATGRAAAAGRLLLVAPNIVDVERRLDVPERDFRLWVCLHEETHRVQFAANPWLRKHMLAEIEAFVAAAPADGGELVTRLVAAVGQAAGAVRSGSELPSLLDLVQTEEQRQVVDRLGAVMSLLEGHADVVMDQAGPSVIPSVDAIRARFEQRRDSAVGLDRILRRLLGLDTKLRQYRDGAVFVRSVTATVGRDGFDAVWSGPAALPTAAEIADPAAWVARVHG